MGFNPSLNLCSQNDDVYNELSKHDKGPDIVWSQESMEAEASSLRSHLKTLVKWFSPSKKLLLILGFILDK